MRLLIGLDGCWDVCFGDIRIRVGQFSITYARWRKRDRPRDVSTEVEAKREGDLRGDDRGGG
jgi:hypothetical protein